MAIASKPDRVWTADEFILTDQHDFGDAWRYELVEGRIVGHAAPAPDHGAILAGLAGALISRLRDMPSGCRPESGSAATPQYKQRNTARIPDVMVRCGGQPRVGFEVISPSELRHRRERDLKRRHMQAVEGIQELVEIYQDDFAVHVYRLMPSGSWAFEALEGEHAVLRLESLGIELPLAEIYVVARPQNADDPPAQA